jgi:glycosyltransferase involved in cell wall biosynthesis
MSPKGLFGRRRQPEVARASAAPTLSVVVPVYNVAAFLPGSLESILRQPMTDLEVVAVDDGSTDGSDRILLEYARRDQRIKVIRQDNSGVSIARNRALDECRGRLLTFVDPDDELPPDAWSSMLRALERTGSDFVVGAAERLEGERRYVTPLMRRNHQQERLGIRIGDAPLMLADIFLWNKIFRRDFWEEHPIRFPERTRYQDQPALTEAFLAASSFDVITEVVYDWRVRPTKDSATQRRVEISNLRERIATKRMTLDLVREHGSNDLMRVLLTEILPIDMWEHFRAAAGILGVERAEYWTVLRDGLREFWNVATVPFEETTVPLRQRLMGWLVDQDRHDDLVRLVTLVDQGGGLRTADGRFDHPWVDDPGLPPSLRSG